MQVTEFYCDWEHGTLEFTFSKKEMQIEGCKVSADYSIRDGLTDGYNYNVDIYIGLQDVEVMEDLNNIKIKAKPGEIKDKIKEYITAYFDVKENRKHMREKLKALGDAQDFPYVRTEIYEFDISKMINNTKIKVDVDRETGEYHVYMKNIFHDLAYIYSAKIDKAYFDVHDLCEDIKKHIELIENLKNKNIGLYNL